MKTRVTVFLAVLGLSLGAAAQAGMILINTAEGQVLEPFYAGQSVTTPSGGPWNNIRFNFYSDLAMTTPTAAGELFIFSNVLAFSSRGGQIPILPADVDETLTGFVAKSSGVVDNAWQFDVSLQLQANTKYWFYSTTQMPVSFHMYNPVTEGEAYASVDAAGPYSPQIHGDYGFALQGTVVPEPASIMMLGLGLGGLLLRKRK